MEVVLTASSCFPRRTSMAISFGNFKTRGRTMPKIMHLQHQQLRIVKKSKVSSTSRLSTSILCYAEHKDFRPTRRRNKLREKLVKEMPKPQIVIESSNIDLENFESNEENKSNVDKTEETSMSINVDEGGSELSRVDPEFIYGEGFKDINTKSLGLKDQVGKMWDEWKDWSEQSQKDFRIWGMGNGPIFLVYESGEGGLKVSVNEKEINNRFGALPFPGEYPDEAKTLLEDKLADAKRVAREIEMGILKPPRNSRIYEIVGSDESNLEKKRLVGSYGLSRVSSVIGSAQRTLRISPIGGFVLCGSLLAWIAWEYMFYNDPVEKESDEDRVRVEGELKEVGVVDLNLRNERGIEKELGLKKEEFGLKDADGLENRVFTMDNMAKQGLGFCAIILENLRLRFRKAQARKEQTVMQRRVEFEKRILKIRYFAGQGLSFLALALQNKRVPAKKQLLMRPASIDGVEFENRIVEIQGMARQVRLKEQNGSQVPLQQEEKDYTKSKTDGRNVDDQRSEEWASNSNVLRKNVFESSTLYASDSNVIPGKVETSSQVNMDVRSSLSSEQVDLKDSSQESATKSSIYFGDGETHRKLKGTKQPKVDYLQDEQTCVEKAANNATKETVNVSETEKVEGNKREHGGKRFSLKGPPRIEPQVLVLVKEAMEILASKSFAEMDDHKATKETVNAPQTEKGLGNKKGFGGKRLAPKRSHRTKSQVVRHVKDAGEISDFKNSTQTMNVPLAEKGSGKERDGNESPAKGLHKIERKGTKRQKEPREISASKNGKHSDELKDNSILSSTRTVLMEPTGTIKNYEITKEETSSNRSMVREKRKKLNPVVRKVKDDSKRKIARGKALENVSVNPLETARDMVKMDVGNTRDLESCSEEAEELEWMRDEVLGKIVSKVQGNDHAGREPFNGLVSEEELLFFKGLERKYEREGEGVKMWIKERVGNLKYGKESYGVSHQPKISTIVFKDSTKEGRYTTSGKIENDNVMFTTKKIGLDKENLACHEDSVPVSVSSSTTSTDLSSMVININQKPDNVLERSMAEEAILYALFSAERKVRNYEAIRELEIVEHKKLVSKDNEFKQERNNHLWWLDLPYVLCIGLSRNNVFKGLYSFELAPVFESARKCRSTVAFEDHADAKNVCYILQSHFNELGDTVANVIPLSTKEFCLEVKSRDLKAIVIKKGELRFFVGQPLKEVESRIIKIGNAMYSEKAREDLDIDPYMTDVFGNKTSIVQQHTRQEDETRMHFFPN